MSEVQSIVFSKKHFNIPKAEKWLKEHGFKTSFYGKKVDETTNTYRYRQTSPKRYKGFRMRRIGKGIQFVIGFY